MPRRFHAPTLTEIALVLIVIGLALGGVLATQEHARRPASTLPIQPSTDVASRNLSEVARDTPREGGDLRGDTRGESGCLHAKTGVSCVVYDAGPRIGPVPATSR